MTAAFADSYFYLALLNPRDAGHQTANSVADGFDGTIVTTQWVLVEVADAFANPRTGRCLIAFCQLSRPIQT